MNGKTRIILTTLLAITGFGMLGSGFYLQFKDEPKTNKKPIINYESNNNHHDIVMKEEQKLKITLKEITLPINSSLSMDIQNYIEETLETTILQNMTLDISKVDTKLSGSYLYYIIYQNDIFEGKILIEEVTTPDLNTEEVITTPETTPQEQPQEKLETKKITLKTITLKLGEKLSHDITSYINETLTEEEKQQLTLDLSNVNINLAGSYQYAITFQNMYYTATISIIEDQPALSTPENEENSNDQSTENTENDTNDDEKTSDTTETNPTEVSP